MSNGDNKPDPDLNAIDAAMERGTVDDGGPAFPNHVETDVSRRGMSLRDYFAGQALTRTQEDDEDGDEKTQAELAAWAYAIADAMLAERAK